MLGHPFLLFYHQIEVSVDEIISATLAVACIQAVLTGNSLVGILLCEFLQSVIWLFLTGSVGDNQSEI